MSDSKDNTPKHIADNCGTNNTRLLNHLKAKCSQCEANAPDLLTTMEQDTKEVTQANEAHENNLQEDIWFCRFLIFEHAGMPKKLAFMPVRQKIGIHADMPDTA